MKMNWRFPRAAFAVSLFAIWPALAGAQSNSMFRKGRPAAAPAANPAPAQANGQQQVAAGLDLPPAPEQTAQIAALAPLPAVNPALLNASLIAVEAPLAKKVQVHDLITIIIREDKRSTTDSKLQSQKKWDVTAELAKWFRLNEENHAVQQAFPTGNPAADFTYDNKYTGNGKLERKDTLQTRITASVLDVKPNGTLVLQARKTIKNDEDSQQMTLTGICRSQDVTADNTILSTQLADAYIDIQNQGPARDASRRGWIQKALDTLRPL